MEHGNEFEQILRFLTGTTQQLLKKMPDELKQEAVEIRLRAGRPLCVMTPARSWFLTAQGELAGDPTLGWVLTQQELTGCLQGICGYSLQAFQDDITGGFITLEGGHRAGVVGTVVQRNGQITAVRDISSLNLRIARQRNGAADSFFEKIFASGLCSVLILGKPLSGKTTLIRDIARQLSNGRHGMRPVAIVDERCEIAACRRGVPQYDIGPNTDVISSCKKSLAIPLLLRSMAPQFIICDELGEAGEIAALTDCLNCGVKVIATAHADSMQTLLKRPVMRRLLQTGAFDKLVLVGSRERVGKIEKITDLGRNTNETRGDCNDRSLLHGGGHYFYAETE